jgi:uncharacterized protein
MNQPGTVQRYAEAWKHNDVLTMLGLYAADVIAHYGGTSPFAGIHRGRDAFIEVLLETSRRSSRALISIDAVHDDGDCGAIFATESMVISGDTVTVERCLRYRIEDDLIAEIWLYDKDQRLVDQAWADS